jgi:hypothetical protein
MSVSLKDNLSASKNLVINRSKSPIKISAIKKDSPFKSTKATISIKTQFLTPKSPSELSQHPLIRKVIMLFFSRNIKNIMMVSVIVSESLSRLLSRIQTQKCKSTKFWHTMLFWRKNLNICSRKIIKSKFPSTHKKHKSKS